MKKPCAVPFCVYLHSIDSHVFYVGMGGPSRPYIHPGRNSVWRTIVEKSGSFDVTIVAWFHTSTEARERETIEILRRRPIANLTFTDPKPKPIKEPKPKKDTRGGTRPGAGRPRIYEERCHCDQMSLKRAMQIRHKCWPKVTPLDESDYFIASSILPPIPELVIAANSEAKLKSKSE